MRKTNILRKQIDFKRVYNKGKSQGSKYLVVLFREKRDEDNRVAFVASKKVGNSVKRNRARRLLREAYREIEGQLKGGYDIVFVARKDIEDAKEPEVLISMKGALKKCDLLK